MRTIHRPSTAGATGPAILRASGLRYWRGPTFAEFVERAEREFGSDTGGLRLMGVGSDERLAASEVRALCSQLGVPPEDFGV